MGFPATGKDLHVHALQLFRCIDGKLAQHWGGISMISLMQQLGIYHQILAPKIAEIYTAMVHRYIDGVNNDDPAALREVLRGRLQRSQLGPGDGAAAGRRRGRSPRTTCSTNPSAI